MRTIEIVGKYWWILLTVSNMFLAVSVALAQGGYGLSGWTVDGGGGSSSGAGYALTGSIGQPEAGPSLSGGGYTLSGGFWGEPSSSNPGNVQGIYLPVILRGD